MGAAEALQSVPSGEYHTPSAAVTTRSPSGPWAAESGEKRVAPSAEKIAGSAGTRHAQPLAEVHMASPQRPKYPFRTGMTAVFTSGLSPTSCQRQPPTTSAGTVGGAGAGESAGADGRASGDSPLGLPDEGVSGTRPTHATRGGATMTNKTAT